MIKRTLDVCGALAVLLVTWPLFLVIALAIKLDSSGPAVYAQVRVGRGGRRFWLYKFRSMCVGADKGAAITGPRDSRITRVGRFLRPVRIDEWPQLFNVLKGDMSLVGPRPETPAVADTYTAEQREILNVRPGITGPTQLAWLDEQDMLPRGVNPDQHYVTYLLPLKLESDLRYVRSRTEARDLGYLIQTPFRLAQLLLSRPGSGRGRKLARLLVDLGAVMVGTGLAFLARYDGNLPAGEARTLFLGLPFVAAAYGAAFVSLRTYRAIWRYSGVEDFWLLLRACLLGGCATAAAMRLLAWPYPRTVLILAPVLAFLFMGGGRLICRTAVTAFPASAKTSKRRRVIIVGAGRTGEAIAREILSRPHLGYSLMGFVDDDPRLLGSQLHNLAVLGTTAELPELAQRLQLDEAIIAISQLSLTGARNIGDACTRAGIEFKTLPSMSQLVRGEGRLRYLRRVNPDDLIRRDALVVVPEKIAGFLRDRKIMVTGAGGSIGSELCRQLAGLGAESLLMVDRAENGLFEICTELQAGRPRPRTQLSAALADVKHVARMTELLNAFKPNLIFHAAAYKHVPILESHPAEAVLNNVVGTVRLADLARAHGVERFVFISTDKAVKPCNLMGATKRVCEMYLMAKNRRPRGGNGAADSTQFRIVRFGNVLGSAGSALPLFQRQIESGSAITITDPEVSRFFMTIQEAVALVLESATLDPEGDITVLDMGEPVRITKLADDLVTALGLPPSAVPKRFIGLRPGEKLHEVLWDDEDEVLPAHHPRIVSLRQAARPLQEMEAYVRELERLALGGDTQPLLAWVQEIVPSYQPRLETGYASIVHLDAVTKGPAHASPAEGPAPAGPVLRPAVNQRP
jgi:FlaA1/EpsC-like NDP-sugar epimerase/lipopolysaccharide/colanic/teichoic acid biosynthesis glycosyltransferase